MIFEFKDVIMVEDDVLPVDLLQDISEHIAQATEDRWYARSDAASWPQYDQAYPIIQSYLYGYCEQADIDPTPLWLENLHFGNIHKYTQDTYSENIYDLHDDIADDYFIAGIFYVRTDNTLDDWQGGELTIHKNFTIHDYPNNILHIQAVSNRIVFFPGRLVHRVRPYFGNQTRQSITFGFATKDQWLLPAKCHLK